MINDLIYEKFKIEEEDILNLMRGTSSYNNYRIYT